jgi:hypothetical protein
MSRIPRIRSWPRVLPEGRAAPAAPANPGGAASMSAGMRPVLGWLSFRRIVDIPFGTCVAALESWQRAGQHGEQQIGHSRLRGPVKHDRELGTCRIEVHLARGPLRPGVRMRLDIDHWSSSPPRTVLELIACQRVRPTASYFRAGHLLLDSLAHRLPQHAPAQRPGCISPGHPHTHQGNPDRWAGPPDPPSHPGPAHGQAATVAAPGPDLDEGKYRT